MFRRTGAVVSAVLLAAGLATAVGAAAAGTSTAVATAAVRTVVLPTGEQVHVGDQGGRILVLQRPGDTPVLVNRVGPHVYALPVPDLGYLGHVLTLGMFDLTALAALPAGRIPVAMAFAGTHSAVPGVTVTSSSGDQAAGYLTPDSAAQFGAALRAQQISGLSSMALATRAAEPVQPNYPQVNVTLRVALPDNPVPDQVAATIVNTDDARRYAQTLEVSNGAQRLSLPKGHYSVLVFGAGLDPATNHQVLRMAFAVDQDIETAGQVIHVDLGSAQQNAFPTYDTPAVAKILDQSQFYILEDDRGRNLGGSWQIFYGHGTSVLAAPSDGGVHGRLVSMNTTVERAAVAGNPLYYLTSAHKNAVVPDEQVEVPAARLSRVETHYYTDGRTHKGISGRSPIYPYYDSGSLTFQRAPVPGVRDEYLFAPPGVVWFNDAQALSDSGGFADMSGVGRYHQDVDYREDLWRGPLAPGVLTVPLGAHTYPYGGPRTCWVCRTATGMSVGLSPFIGSQPDYGALLFAAPGQRPNETRLTVYRDRDVVFDGYNSAGGLFSGANATFDTPSDSHAYRIVETANRAVDGLALSTTATTDYRFESSATSGPDLDPSWDCGAPGTGTCTVLPLLAVRVPLPTSLTGTLPTGDSFLIADVSHVQGATPSSITGFDIAISAAGSAYVPQTVVDLGGGRYYVAIHNTAAPGTAVSVRWHATDAAGGSIVQRVHDAYTIEGN